MEAITVEQEIHAFVEALNSPEGRMVVQLLDATAPRLQEIHADLEDLNDSLAKILSRLEGL
jgi:anti-sigma factor RsiW